MRPPAFRQQLVAAGLADAADGQLGVRVDAAGDLPDLPWANVDRVRIRFDGPVNVDVSNLAVVGPGHGVYGDYRTFSYDRATNTATWTLVRPLRDERPAFVLDGSTPAGVRFSTTALRSPLLLDGDNGGTLPSGDGAAGGDFRFTVPALTGDADRNGPVDAADVLLVRSREGGGGGAGRDVFCDLNGDGRVNALDLRLVLANRGRAVLAPAVAAALAGTLGPGGDATGTRPGGAPGAVPGAAPGAVPRRRGYVPATGLLA